MTFQPASASSVISTLNSLLQSEQAAVATYQQAQQHLRSQLGADLESNAFGHHRRIAMLSRRIRELGGEPTVRTGMWCGFSKALATSPDATSLTAALAHGEELGLTQYKAALHRLDPLSRHLALNDLLPNQERTHARMSMAKRTISERPAPAPRDCRSRGAWRASRA